jgi:hypothetical protein
VRNWKRSHNWSDKHVECLVKFLDMRAEVEDAKQKLVRELMQFGDQLAKTEGMNSGWVKLLGSAGTGEDVPGKCRLSCNECEGAIHEVPLGRSEWEPVLRRHLKEKEHCKLDNTKELTTLRDLWQTKGTCVEDSDGGGHDSFDINDNNGGSDDGGLHGEDGDAGGCDDGSGNSNGTELGLAESNSDDAMIGSAGGASNDDGLEQLAQKLKERHARLLCDFNEDWNRHRLWNPTTTSFYHPMLCGACTGRDLKVWGKCARIPEHSVMATESAGCEGAALRSERYRPQFRRDYRLCICNDCVKTSAGHKFPCDKWVLSRDTPEGEQSARQWAEQQQALQQQQQQQHEALQQTQQEAQLTQARNAEQDRVLAMVRAKFADEAMEEDGDDAGSHDGTEQQAHEDGDGSNGVGSDGSDGSNGCGDSSDKGSGVKRPAAPVDEAAPPAGKKRAVGMQPTKAPAASMNGKGKAKKGKGIAQTTKTPKAKKGKGHKNGKATAMDTWLHKRTGSSTDGRR